MSILIRNGTLLTMLQDAPVQADIMIADGRIQRIGKDLNAGETTRTLDATGCVITPGMIDLHICLSGEGDETIHRAAVKAGITSGLCWKEAGGMCLGIGAAAGKRFHMIDLQAWTDDGLKNELTRIMRIESCMPACVVHDPVRCLKILKACQTVGCTVLLAGLSGCESLMAEIAASGCPVVIGNRQMNEGSPWEFAAELLGRGSLTALTSRAQETRFGSLRICSMLCRRAGASFLDAMRMVTSIPAKIAGIADAGVICEGFRADLCIFDGDPLLLATSHLATVSAGRIIAA